MHDHAVCFQTGFLKETGMLRWAHWDQLEKQVVILFNAAAEMTHFSCCVSDCKLHICNYDYMPLIDIWMPSRTWAEPQTSLDLEAQFLLLIGEVAGYGTNSCYCNPTDNSNNRTGSTVWTEPHKPQIHRGVGMLLYGCSSVLGGC